MNFNLELTGAEVNIIVGALAKQPYEAVAQLIEKVISLVNKQNEQNKLEVNKEGN
jgi:hypothetical protein